jgi:hypothetical protein
MMLSSRFIGARIEVHRHLGPGTKGVRLACGYRLDIVLRDLLLVEIKATRACHPPTIAGSFATNSRRVTPR